jgi:hypothetical protein
MSDAKKFLNDARKSFLLAGASQRINDMERYAAMGRDYLQLADKAAKKIESLPLPSWWRLP